MTVAAWRRITGLISAGELPILLLASPFFLFPRPSLIPALLVLPLLWLVRYHTRGHIIPRTPVDWPILGLMLMVLVGVGVTPDLGFSLGKIAGTIYGVGIFYAMAEVGHRQRSLLPVALIAVALGAGAAVLSLLGTDWTIKWRMMARVLSYLPEVIRGVPGNESGFNPNQVSGVMIMFVPLQLGLLAGLVSGGEGAGSRARKAWLVVGLGASLALTTGVILLAQSRAAWLALAFGLLAGLAIVVKRLRPAVLVLLVAGLVALVAIGPVGLGEWLVQQRLMTGSTAVSWEARVELWSRALWTLADFPLTGTGMNMFRRVVWQLYPLFHFPQGADVGHAHNIFLQAGLDLGLPGLICYLALWGGTLAWGWKAYRSSPSRLVQLTILGSVVGLAVHAAWGLLDVVALGAKQNFLWWAMAALAITASVQDRIEGLARAG